MSYEICYDRRFLKSELGITPLWLAGSNNCYEYHRDTQGRRYERRERSWSPLFNVAGIPQEELMDKVRSFLPSTYQQHFKYRGKWVDDKGFLSFVENGIKNAVTIEELEEAMGFTAFSARLIVWKYNPEKGYSDREHDEEVQKIATTQDLDAWIRVCKMRMADKKEGESIYYCIELYTDDPIRVPRKAPKDTPVVAKVGNQYVIGVSAGGFSYGPDYRNAMIFASEEDAKQQISLAFHRRLSFVRAETIEARKQWRWVVRVADGYYQGRYIVQQTRSRLRMSRERRDARRFPSKAAAERYIASLGGRYTASFEAEEVIE